MRARKRLESRPRLGAVGPRTQDEVRYAFDNMQMQFLCRSVVAREISDLAPVPEMKAQFEWVKVRRGRAEVGAGLAVRQRLSAFPRRMHRVF